MAKKKIALVTALLLFISSLGLFPGMWTAAAAAEEAPSFRLVLERNNAYLHEDTTLWLEGQNVQDLYSFEAVVEYDPAHIQIVKAASSLSGGLSPNLSGNNGRWVFAFTKTGSAAGENGHVRLAAFTVRGLQADQAEIRLASVKTINSSLTKEEHYTGNQVVLTVMRQEDSTSSSPDETPAAVTPSPALAGIKRIADQMQGPYRKAAYQLDEEWLKQQNKTGASPIVIRLPAAEAMNGYTLFFPADWINGSYGRSLQLESEYGAVTLPPDMLGNSGISAQTAGFSLTRLLSEHIPAQQKEAVSGYPAYQLELSLNGELMNWSNPSAPVSVSFPYKASRSESAHPESIVIRYVDEQGAGSTVPSGRYDPSAGRVAFRTSHFSLYAIGYKEVAFRDLGSAEWARTAVSALAARDIAHGTSEGLYSPGLSVKRGDFIKLLMGVVENSGDINRKVLDFADVDKSSYYYTPIMLARQLGIAEGGSDNRFEPEAFITRQDVMALVDRALRLTSALRETPQQSASVLLPYADREELADYATAAAANLVARGYIQGYDSKLHPLQPMSRAEAAVFIDAIISKR